MEKVLEELSILLFDHIGTTISDKDSVILKNINEYSYIPHSPFYKFPDTDNANRLFDIVNGIIKDKNTEVFNTDGAELRLENAITFPTNPNNTKIYSHTIDQHTLEMLNLRLLQPHDIFKKYYGIDEVRSISSVVNLIGYTMLEEIFKDGGNKSKYIDERIKLAVITALKEVYPRDEEYERVKLYLTRRNIQDDIFYRHLSTIRDRMERDYNKEDQRWYRYEATEEEKKLLYVRVIQRNIEEDGRRDIDNIDDVPSFYMVTVKDIIGLGLQEILTNRVREMYRAHSDNNNLLKDELGLFDGNSLKEFFTRKFITEDRNLYDLLNLETSHEKDLSNEEKLFIEGISSDQYASLSSETKMILDKCFYIFLHKSLRDNVFVTLKLLETKDIPYTHVSFFPKLVNPDLTYYSFLKQASQTLKSLNVVDIRRLTPPIIKLGLSIEGIKWLVTSILGTDDIKKILSKYTYALTKYPDDTLILNLNAQEHFDVVTLFLQKLKINFRIDTINGIKKIKMIPPYFNKSDFLKLSSDLGPSSREYFMKLAHLMERFVDGVQRGGYPLDDTYVDFDRERYNFKKKFKELYYNNNFNYDSIVENLPKCSIDMSRIMSQTFNILENRKGGFDINQLLQDAVRKPETPPDIDGMMSNNVDDFIKNFRSVFQGINPPYTHLFNPYYSTPSEIEDRIQRRELTMAKNSLIGTGTGQSYRSNIHKIVHSLDKLKQLDVDIPETFKDEIGELFKKILILADKTHTLALLLEILYIFSKNLKDTRIGPMIGDQKIKLPDELVEKLRNDITSILSISQRQITNQWKELQKKINSVSSGINIGDPAVG